MSNSNENANQCYAHDILTRNWYQKTGTRNWYVCHAIWYQIFLAPVSGQYVMGFKSEALRWCAYIDFNVHNDQFHWF